MSENTWEIMKGMELGDVELQMALQCAPVITGVKVSNLLNIELSGYRQMVEILKDSDICMYTLGATCGRVNVFIYNAAKLRAPGKISDAIAAECVIPEHPIVSTNASWMIPSLTLRVNLHPPC